MSEITGGELLLKALAAEGVSVIFGILDGSFNAFLAKLDKYDVRFVNTRHEAAAAHMAEAWARVRGEPAVVAGGIGPGAANMLSGIITAHAEGSPVIALSGQRRRNIIYPDRGGGFQNVPLIDLYRPVTKWSGGARQWRRLPELVRHAYRAATTGRPGPVYLEIPEDIMRATGDEESVDVWSPARYRPGRPTVGDPERVKEAAALLAAARRPLLHAGSGVAWAGAGQQFMALADHLGAALTTSLGARGVVPEDHPRFLHPLNRDLLEAVRGEADVVLVVGSRVGELDTWGKAPSWGAPGEQQVIQVDVDPHSIGLNRPVEVGIVGDAGAVLGQLLEEARSLVKAREGAYPGFEKYAPLHRARQEELAEVLERDVDGINPGRLVRIVRDFFPRNAITVQDGGNTSIWAVNYNPIYEPRSYLYTAKFGHLGTGLPYALGAKMAAPERPVYLVTGDGAVGFNIQELETARRYDLPVTVIVVCDNGWGMERSSQLFAQMGGMVETELYSGARYDRVAEAFGCHGECVETEAEIRPALERATASGKPALIQVMVDRMANLAPPGLLEFGSLVYRAED